MFEGVEHFLSERSSSLAQYRFGDAAEEEFVVVGLVSRGFHADGDESLAGGHVFHSQQEHGLADASQPAVDQSAVGVSRFCPGDDSVHDFEFLLASYEFLGLSSRSGREWIEGVHRFFASG